MSIIAQSWKIGKDVFFDPQKRIKAISLLVAAVIFELCMVYSSVLIAQWYNDFYTSLQNLDKAGLYHNLQVFTLIITFTISAFIIKYLCQSYFSMLWRTSLTEKYLDKWIKSKAYYGANLLEDKGDNPDQRISQDLDSFVNSSITLSLGLLNSIVTLISFIVMLWSLSGTLNFTLFNIDFAINGYLVWTALIYSFISTIITFRIGRNLSKVDYLQEKKEANFRFSLMRFRENAESISLYKGENYEQNIFKLAFDEIIHNFFAIIKIHRNLGIWSNFARIMSGLVPIILASPRLFAKEINFGGLMQIRMAFGNIEEAFSFFASSFTSIASYKAVIKRICEFEQNIQQWQNLVANNTINLSEDAGNDLIIKNLTLKSPKGNILQENLNYHFKAGQSYLITGKNGAGKSTFLKTLGKIWIFGDGEIIFPQGKLIFFIPQHVYMPFGSLAQAISYPLKQTFTDEYILELLEQANISYLSPRLHHQENWSISLSLGEQQKIAILRAIIHKPDILIMDESSSSLNEKDETKLHHLIKQKLPKATIISVGHRASLKEFHAEELVFT